MPLRVMLLIIALALSLATPAPAQKSDEAARLNAEVERLYGQGGRDAEAIPLAERGLAMREKALPAGHLDIAASLNNLALLYQAQGRLAEAEPLLKRALVMRETALPAGHLDIAESLNNLALLYQAQGRLSEAEPLYKRALAFAVRALPAGHPVIAESLHNLAFVYSGQGRYAEAEPLLKRALAIYETALPAGHPDIASSLNNLAILYFTQGRHAEAEALLKRTLAMRETTLPAGHPAIAASLNNLAALYKARGRLAAAEPLLKRALAMRETALPAGHPAIAESLNHLASLYQAQGRLAAAEPLYMRALAMREKALPARHPDIAESLNNLAGLYKAQGRLVEAERHFKRALSIAETALPAGHPDIATNLNNLGMLYKTHGRLAAAEPLLKRALAIYETALPAGHPDIALSLNNLAVLYFAQSDWARATDYLRRGTAIIARRSRRGGGEIGGLSGATKSEAARSGLAFPHLVKAAWRHARADAAAEMFAAAQWALSSEAASALARMAARGAAGTPRLASLVRERQDLVGEWQGLDKLLAAAAARPPEKRNAKTEQQQRARLATIDARIGAIDKRLAKDFPDYASLADPGPLALADAQAQLRPDEALILTLDTPKWDPTPEETFVWVVTKTTSRWLRADIGTDTLQREVTALRCGLDETAWSGGTSNCAALVGPMPAGGVLPFDPARAHRLYKALFGKIDDLIKDKHLLIVPSGPLTQLPFHVLVTAPPSPRPSRGEGRGEGQPLAAAQPAAHPRIKSGAGPNPLPIAPRRGLWREGMEIAWLARRNAITVLPAVSSLKALRANAKASRATAPFIGFGDPVLAGNPRCGKIIVPDRCPDEAERVAAAPRFFGRIATALAALPSLFRDGQADVAKLRELCPLPDTAHELKCVAKSLGARTDSLVLGPQMTEAAVKAAPLQRYRVVHFATHGLLAGQTAKLAKLGAEPALVFTPPDKASEADDGLLTASEIAALKLDADWVVMSACNTAGPAGGQERSPAGGGQKGTAGADAASAEALSGLARAFFYAGARALLVSHWPVDSYAATMLTSRTFAEMRAAPQIGRAEAFRRAMLALMSDKRRPWAAHPAVWAPFVVVGEGGAGR